MKPLRLVDFALTCLLPVTLSSCSRSDSPRIEVSAPMVAILKAAKTADATMFRDAYSARVREEGQRSDWGKNLEEARATMKDKFGDYQISDFSFSFDGDDAKGKLEVSFKGKTQFALAVVKEGGAWKLDER